jgi:hypothetical protein
LSVCAEKLAPDAPGVPLTNVQGAHVCAEEPLDRDVAVREHRRLEAADEPGLLVAGGERREQLGRVGMSYESTWSV